MADKGFWQSIWNSLKGIFSNGSGAYTKHLQDYYSENPDSYLGWDNVKNIGESYINQYTQAGLTGREKAMMEYQTQERESAQAFEERLSNTSYQRAVADMQGAGLNPALMYGNGASGASTPSSSGQTAPGYSPSSMSDLIQLLTLKPTLRNLNADSRVKEADAKDKLAGAKLKASETEYRDAMTAFQRMVNNDFPEKNRAEIDNIIENTSALKTKQDVDRAEKAYKDAETALRKLEADNFDEFRSAQIALLKAQKKEALSQADLNAVRKMFEKVQYDYAHDNKMLMASSEGFGIAMAIASVFGLNIEKIRKGVREGNEWISKNMSPEEIVDVFGGD